MEEELIISRYEPQHSTPYHSLHDLVVSAAYSKWVNYIKGNTCIHALLLGKFLILDEALLYYYYLF
jgi:hypothetical protein